MTRQLAVLLLCGAAPLVAGQPSVSNNPECGEREKDIVYACAQYSDYMEGCLEHKEDGCIWCPQYKSHIKTRNLCRTAQAKYFIEFPLFIDLSYTF